MGLVRLPGGSQERQDGDDKPVAPVKGTLIGAFVIYGRGMPACLKIRIKNKVFAFACCTEQGNTVARVSRDLLLWFQFFLQV